MSNLFLLFLFLLPLKAQNSISLPVELNKRPIGEIEALLEDQTLVSLEIDPIKPALKELIIPERFQLIQSLEGMVPVKKLQEIGLQVDFDFPNLKIYINVPPSLQLPQSISFAPQPVTFGTPIAPAQFSAYMNVRSFVDYNWTGREGFSDPVFQLENVFHTKGITLENDLIINPNLPHGWQKQDTRITYDIPDHRIRINAGDLIYPTVGLQNFIPMAGLSIYRLNSLQPFYITRPYGSTTITLESASRVEIFVNGRPYSTMNLEPGTYNLNDFFLSTGINDVLIRIVDSFGKEEYIHSKFYYQDRLLRPGESEFNFAVGFPSRSVADSPFYEYSTKPLLSSYYRVGLWQHFTAGINIQLSELGQNLGAENTVATALGNFILQSALSHNETVGLGHSHRFAYEYRFFHEQRWPTYATLTIGPYYESPEYAPINPFQRTIMPKQEALWGLSAIYAQRISRRLSGSIGYSRAFGGREFERINFTIGYYLRLAYLSFTFQRTVLPEKEEFSAYVAAHLTLGKGHYLYNTYNTATEVLQTSYHYNWYKEGQFFHGTLSMVHSPVNSTFYGSGRYLGQHFELTLSQEANLDGNFNRTSIQWGSAICYADGAFAISRPINDAFLIVDSGPRIAQEGGVELEGYRSIFPRKLLVDAVVPSVISYYPTHFRIVPRNPQSIIERSESDINVNLPYRAGAFLRVGAQPLQNVTVTLLWADGRPASLQTGKLQPGDIEFFTNFEGMTFIGEIKPGRYTATLTGYPDKPFEIVVPKSEEPVLHLGTITLPIENPSRQK